MPETAASRPLHMGQSSEPGSRTKVVLGKMAFDAHDIGARYVARKLVDAGMEVVFLRFALVRQLVEAALQEDADVIGVSCLTGGHMSVARDLVDQVRGAGLEDRLLMIGGVIADQDVSVLREMGLHGVFGPGTDTEEIVAFIRRQAKAGV